MRGWAVTAILKLWKTASRHSEGMMHVHGPHEKWLSEGRNMSMGRTKKGLYHAIGGWEQLGRTKNGHSEGRNMSMGRTKKGRIFDLATARLRCSAASLGLVHNQQVHWDSLAVLSGSHQIHNVRLEAGNNGVSAAAVAAVFGPCSRLMWNAHRSSRGTSPSLATYRQRPILSALDILHPLRTAMFHVF